jgi:hypothetical protein
MRQNRTRPLSHENGSSDFAGAVFLSGHVASRAAMELFTYVGSASKRRCRVGKILAAVPEHRILSQTLR